MLRFAVVVPGRMSTVGVGLLGVGGVVVVVVVAGGAAAGVGGVPP